MRKVLMLILTLFNLSGAATLPAHTSLPLPGVGEKVDVKWRQGWWPATVLAVKAGRYEIQYDDFHPRWNEWVGPSRIRRLHLANLHQQLAAKRNQFTAGERVLVKWGGAWWLGQIQHQKNQYFYVSYDGWATHWNEWVDATRLRPRTAADSDISIKKPRLIEPVD